MSYTIETAYKCYKSAYCMPKRIICMLQKHALLAMRAAYIYYGSVSCMLRKHGLHAMGALCMCYRSYNLTVLQSYSYNLHPIEVAR